MQKPRWSIIALSASPGHSVRRRRVSRVVFGLFWVIALAGLGGLVRLGFFAASYAVARFGVYQEYKENRNLVRKIEFLSRFARQESRRVRRIAAYENKMRLKYGMNTISDEVRKAGIGGRPTAEELALQAMTGPEVSKADSVRQSISALLRSLELQNKTFSRMGQYVKRQHDRWAQRPSVWPARGRVTSGFGHRIHPLTGYLTFHEGLDIANKPWTPIFATADGIVADVGRKQYYGNIVVLDHPGSGHSTYYAHLKQPAVVEGQFVRRGELVGYMGRSGRTTGTHLHYEVRKGNRVVNPSDYILPLDTVVD